MEERGKMKPKSIEGEGNVFLEELMWSHNWTPPKCPPCPASLAGDMPSLCYQKKRFKKGRGHLEVSSFYLLFMIKKRNWSPSSYKFVDVLSFKPLLVSAEFSLAFKIPTIFCWYKEFVLSQCFNIHIFYYNIRCRHLSVFSPFGFSYILDLLYTFLLYLLFVLFFFFSHNKLYTTITPGLFCYFCFQTFFSFP